MKRKQSRKIAALVAGALFAHMMRKRGREGAFAAV